MRVFSCEIAKALRTSFYTKHLRWLLLAGGLPIYKARCQKRIANFVVNVL